MPEGNDARWLAENVVLPAINRLEGKIDNQNVAVWEELSRQNSCLTKIKVGVEGLKGKYKVISINLKHIKESFYDHRKDKSSHFNPHFSETRRQRLARKAPEIGITMGGGTGIAGLGSQE